MNIPTDAYHFKISSTFSISHSLAFSLSLTNKSCIHYMHKYTRRAHTHARTHAYSRMNVNKTVENQIDKHDDRAHAVQIQYEYSIMREKLNNVFCVWYTLGRYMSRLALPEVPFIPPHPVASNSKFFSMHKAIRMSWDSLELCGCTLVVSQFHCWEWEVRCMQIMASTSIFQALLSLLLLLLLLFF